jgi:hypothetical protein
MREALEDWLNSLSSYLAARRIFETRRFAEEQITLVELAEEFGVSRERVRQIELSAFAKVQNAVNQRVAAMATRPLCRCVSFQPLPWRETLTMDVSLWVRFTATERRETGRRSPDADRALARRSTHGTLHHRTGA